MRNLPVTKGDSAFFLNIFILTGEIPMDFNFELIVQSLPPLLYGASVTRSEERRVGKEC